MKMIKDSLKYKKLEGNTGYLLISSVPKSI